MRIVRLDCLAFGPFTEYPLVFGDQVPGLHVVYGPNEAGKTSALRALRQLLFGIPHASTDNFLHPHPNLRIRATLRGHDGTELTIVRRKGLKHTLRGPDDEEIIPPEKLQALLPNVDESTFCTRFGIDYDELQAGGEAVAEQKGDLSELLFAAGAGIARLGRIHQQLEEQANALFTPRATKPRINQGISALKQARDGFQKSRLPTAEFVQLDGELRQARAELERVTEIWREKQTLHYRLTRIDAAMPLVAHRQQCAEELASLADAPRLPAGVGEQRIRAQQELTFCTQQVERIRRELEQLEEETSQLVVEEKLLAAGEVIKGLQQSLGSHRKAAQDRAKLVALSRDLERNATRLLGDILGRTAEIEELAAVRLSGSEKVRIQDLIGELQKHEGRLQAAQQQLRELEKKQSRMERELNKLPPAVDTGELKRAIQHALQHVPVERRMAAARQQLARHEADLLAKLRRLGLWQGSPDQIETLAVPSAETIEQFAADIQAGRDALARARQRVEENEARDRDCQQQLTQLEMEQDVPTLSDLEAARRDREALWSVVRRRLLNEPLGDAADLAREGHSQMAAGAELAGEFERRVQAADRIADRLRMEANRVKAKADLLAQQQGAIREVAAARAMVEEATARCADVQRRWEAAWQPLGLVPLSPREMKGWAARHAELAALAAQVRVLRAEIEQDEQQVLQAARRLDQTRQPSPFPEPDGAAGIQLADRVARSQQWLDACEANHSQRLQLRSSLDELAAEIPPLRAERDRLAAELDRIRQQWADAVKPLFLSPQATPAEANQALNAFQELRGSERELESLQERITGIDRDAQQFEEEVSQIVGELAPDLAAMPPQQAAAELHQRWQRACQLQDRREQAIAKREKWQAELAAMIARRDEAQARLDTLLSAAGCSSLDELPTAEIRSERRRYCETELQRLDEQLAGLAGHEPVTEFVAAAAGHDADVLRSSLDQLATEIQQLKDQQQELATRIGGLENQFQQLDAGDPAQEAEEDIQNLAAALRDDVQQYIRLRAAASVLRKAMERYREKNQAPVLERASARFKQLTCGSFDGLRVEYGDQDRPFLVGVRAGTRQTVQVEGMSTGTRDQLYLALRLASLEHYLDEHPPVPFVVDDILIQFDDERAAATLGVLRELAHRTQIIFFTHHAHLVQLARETIPASELCVHELGAGSGERGVGSMEHRA